MNMTERREWAVVIVVVVLVVVFMIVVAPRLYPAELHGDFRFGKTLENDWAIAELQLELHHSIWRFDNVLYGGWETWMVYGFRSKPFKDIYSLGYRVGYNNFYAEIEHFCNHPVYSSYNAEWWEQNRRSGNALTTVSIGVKW